MANEPPKKKVIEGRQFDSFVESPTRTGRTAREVYVGNNTPIEVTGSLNVSDSGLDVGIADGNVSAVKCLYQTLIGVALANNNVDLEQATVTGISVSAASSGDQVKYQKNGEYFDSSLNFTLNDPLYLDVNGNITDVAPSLPGTYIVQIGTAIAGGIDISIQVPILNP